MKENTTGGITKDRNYRHEVAKALHVASTKRSRAHGKARRRKANKK